MGDVNLRSASAKAFIFHTPQNGAKEQHLSMASKTTGAVLPVSAYPQIICSVHGHTKEIGGKMVRMTYAVRNGEVLKVFCQRRTGFNKMTLSACQFLRLRSTGPLCELKMRLLTDPLVHEPAATVTGRFDLIDLEKAKSLGIAVLPHFEKMFHQSMVDEVMSLRLLAPELAKCETVIKDDGSETTMLTEKRKRFIKK